jgi:hypothetical protein
MAALTLQDISTDTGTATGPLSSLDNTKTLTPLYYPSDLGSSTKNHYVKFTVKQIIASAGTQASPNSNLSESVTSKNGLIDKITTFNYTPATSSPVSVICLYMPDTLNASYNASYDQLNLTNDLGFGVMGVQGVSAVKDLFTSDNKGSAKSIDPWINAALDITASSVLSKFGLGGSGVTDVLLQNQGYAINPQLQMIFRGMDFRQFQLSFMFTPASKAEASTVNKIIGEFKYHFSPDLITPQNAVSGMFFVPPSIFNLQFMFDTDENEYLPRYGDCILKDIDINYAPNGFAAHTDGSPVQIQLTLTFQEIEIVTKAKIQAGYNASSSSPIGSGTSGTITGLR